MAALMEEAAGELRSLIAKATAEDLSDGGRYFAETYDDLTRCRHEEIGEYQHATDGELIEWLWNRRNEIADLYAAHSEPRPVAGEDEETAYRKWWDNERNKPDAAWQGSPYRAAFAAGFRLATHSPAPTEAGRAEAVLAAFNGGMVRVPEPSNPRGYIDYYRPLDAMRHALTSTQGGAEG